jgi:lipoyl(octanoyl) transferase
MTRALTAYRLGRIAYADAHALQERLVEARKQDQIGDTLLLLEHPKVITLGRAAKRVNVLLSESALAARGYELFETGRGGDVTYHGPGQLVGYPIVALEGARRDAHRYLRELEDALIAAVADYGVAASRVAGLTGVWVGDAKLAAIGVRIGTGWITSHGFALNVGRDVSGFGLIVPCGIRDRSVTSLTRCAGRELTPAGVAGAVATRVASRLGYVAVWDDAAVSSPAVHGRKP